MSFDWRLYIQLADELISSRQNTNLNDAYIRTALSRSYYGVYGIASNFIQTKFSLPSFNIHKFVIQKFESSSNYQERLIGSNLSKLWRRRKKADYSQNAPLNLHTANQTVMLANRTIQELENLGAI